MTIIAYGLLGFTVLAILLHISTITIAAIRCRVSAARVPEHDWPPVTIIRPVCGLDEVERATLASTFALDAANVEVLFCCATTHDPAVPYLRHLIAQNGHFNARLLIGLERHSCNPKLDNLTKGWREAKHDWIILSDSNLDLPPDYVARVMAGWRSGTGLVSAPPIGSHPLNFWAVVECAFLNTYQARWQYTADCVGFGFAQGKTLAWRRADLDRWGGITALGQELAEDAAATKIVRTAGRHVHLAGPGFAQPLGHRTPSQVWNRQARWATLRKLSFPLFFMPEVLTGVVPPIFAAVVAAGLLDVPPTSPIMLSLLVAVWFGSEAVLARAAGWHLTWASPVAWLLRDLMIAPIWLSAWASSGYQWHGATISTIDTEATRLQDVGATVPAGGPMSESI